MNARAMRGWTLIELLVSITILSLLLLFAAEILQLSRGAWQHTHTALRRQLSEDAARSVLLHELPQATLQARSEYDGDTAVTVRESDLHFVCGPAAELLPQATSALGDAIFFHALAPDEELRQTLQARGFWCEYSTGESWQPAFLPMPQRKRFRLLCWHPPATSFQPPAASGTAPGRQTVYAWFQQRTAHVSVVAEDVLAMHVQAMPGSLPLYDSRHHEWAAGHAGTSATRHQLPRELHITLLIIDEASLARLSAAQADELQSRLVQTAALKPGGLRPDFTLVQEQLATHHVSSHISSFIVPLMHEQRD